jgi:predicted HAD superfamily Cof-like phosphohydrolase
VALGTAHYEDFDFNEAFKRVHEANMKKVRKPSKRSQWDVVKPEGWLAPNIKDCV